MDEADTLYIVTEDGREVDVERATWHNIRYRYNEQERKVEEEELGTFTQFPIRLAWAITIHKSQGLTFSRVNIDLTGGAFTGGQTYVALSRCTSLQGITLKKQVERGDVFVRPDIVQFATRFNNQQAVERALKLAQADVQYAEAARQFDKGDMEACLEAFFKAIHSRYDIEKPLPRRLIRRKLSTLTALRAENQRLREEMRLQQLSLRKYAKEYYELGNMSLKAHSLKSALANYDKALELNPAYADAWVAKGGIYEEERKHHEAERCYNEALAHSPALFKALFHRGKLRLDMKHYEEAAGDLDRASSLMPDDILTHELFGQALLQCGKPDEAAVQWAIAEQLTFNRKKKKK
jgi:YD repeat-containing protein